MKEKSKYYPIQKHPLYNHWKGMKARCYGVNTEYYSSYGGSGITVCERWHDFEAFADDMGPKPTKKHSLDRIDNEKGYFKSNCRWATAAEQTANRRMPKTCWRGHAWTNESTIFTTNGKQPVRRCRICLKNYEEARKQQRKNK